MRPLARPPMIVAVGEPDAPLLSLETLRRQCSVIADSVDSDGNPVAQDDPILLDCLAAAVEHAENFTGIAIALRTYELAADAFPSVWDRSSSSLELRGPLVDITEFYVGAPSDMTIDTAPEYDSDGVQVNYVYTMDTFSQIPSVRPLGTWPTLVESTNQIRIVFRAGYSSEGNPSSDGPPLPAAIRRAVLLMVGHWYNAREDAAEKALTEIPNGFETLLRPYRVKLGMA